VFRGIKNDGGTHEECDVHVDVEPTENGGVWKCDLMAGGGE
jgi:hypothetical protein